jgi:hypothetical protein
MKRIADAAHYVAGRDRKPVIEVFAEFEQNRFKNGVQRNHKALKAALNRRATSQLRACGVERPKMTAESVACKIQDTKRKVRCKNYFYNALMHLEEATKAAKNAEEAREASELAD